MRTTSGRSASQAGFSFIEVLIAMSVLLVGSVAVLSLFAVGAQDALQRKIDARLAVVRPEVWAIVQDALDARPPGEMPAPIRDMPLSRKDYTLDVDFARSRFGGPRVEAHAVLNFRGRPVRVLPPIPLTRSTLAPQ